METQTQDQPANVATPPTKGGSAATLGSALLTICAEVDRATEKFPLWPDDPLHALAVLGEEYGELTKEMLQLVYEPHKTSPIAVRKEAIQTAAMCVRLVLSLDEYDYRRSPQHTQNDGHEPPAPERKP